MSLSNECRLCVRICTGYTSLYDNAGEQSEICVITLKYFDPEFLKVDQTPEYAILCLECCQHIMGFYNFQQSIIETQNNLYEHKRQCNKNPDAYEFISDDSSIAINHEETISLSGDSNTNVAACPGDTICSPDIEPVEDCVSAEEEHIDYPQCSNESIAQCEIEEIYDDSNDCSVRLTSTLNHTADDSILLSDSSAFDYDADSDQSWQAPSTSKRIKKNRLREENDAVIAQWKPHLECIVCRAKRQDFESLRRHFRAAHPREKCRFKCCNRTFTKRCILADHARYHLNPESFKCEVCNSVQKSRRALYDHMRADHSYVPKKTQKIDMVVECVICNSTLANFADLRQHFRLEHPGRSCFAMCCSRKFERGNIFEQHIRLHVNPNAYMCEICGKSMSRPDTLQGHMLRIHTSLKNAFN